MESGEQLLLLQSVTRAQQAAPQADAPVSWTLQSNSTDCKAQHEHQRGCHLWRALALPWPANTWTQRTERCTCSYDSPALPQLPQRRALVQTSGAMDSALHHRASPGAPAQAGQWM